MGGLAIGAKPRLFILEPRRLALARRSEALPNGFAQARFWAGCVLRHPDSV
jgi:hypothetical protein